MALAVAIFALVVIGALVAGVFFAAQLEQRTGRNTLYATEAAQAAEAGADVVLADWDQFDFNNLANGDSAVLATTTLGAASGHTSYAPKVLRLNDDLFLIRTLGTRTDASGSIMAQRLVGTMARLKVIKATAKAAVTVSKAISFKGTSFIVNGNDSVPQGWAGEPGCNTGADVAGIRSDTSSGANSKDKKNLFGNPPQVENDPTVTNDFFNIFGDVTFDELKKSADIVITDVTPQHPEPTVTAGPPARCNLGDMNNWGEPHRPPDAYVAECKNYFPIIYASGTQLKLAGGARGQGLLLIEGDLEAVGNFEFNGLIVAKGGIKIAGTGNKITGALLAQSVNLDDENSIAGNTTLQFSSCALSKAIKGSAYAEPLSNRSWVQLY
jgi:hypothetical protein